MSNSTLQQALYGVTVILFCFSIDLKASSGTEAYIFSADTAEVNRIVNEFKEIGTVNSLIIEQENRRIVEEYFDSMNSKRTNNIKSASKSILSLLIGIALDKGFLDSTEQTIDEFFPEWFDENPDSVKASITIKDLLTMRSGLETTSFHNYGRWVLSKNWVQFALEQPVTGRPGGRMIYSTGTTHLLSAILTKASGMSTRKFAKRYLFKPMDIEIGGWDLSPEGYYMGGNNMALRTEALFKIGRMVMDMGVYKGNQIVSSNWIVESFKVYTRSNFNPYDYGYLWWRRKTAGYEVAFAWGNGGQYILMIPELDAVIAITSDNNRPSRSRRYQRDVFHWLATDVIPFLESECNTCLVNK